MEIKGDKKGIREERGELTSNCVETARGMLFFGHAFGQMEGFIKSNTGKGISPPPLCLIALLLLFLTLSDFRVILSRKDPQSNAACCRQALLIIQ